MSASPKPATALEADSTSPAARRRLTTQAWASLFAAQATVIKKLQKDSVFKELTMREYDVLYTLSICPSDWVALNELNRYVLLTQPSISRLVDRLEARGLIERRGDDSDRRKVLLSLTLEGTALQRKIGRLHVQDIEQLLSPALSNDELMELARLSDKLRQSLDPTLSF